MNMIRISESAVKKIRAHAKAMILDTIDTLPGPSKDRNLLEKICIDALLFRILVETGPKIKKSTIDDQWKYEVARLTGWINGEFEDPSFSLEEIMKLTKKFESEWGNESQLQSLVSKWKESLKDELKNQASPIS